MTEWSYQMFVFFVAHLIAMSSTVYNPFVYAWFNDTFRAQLRKLVPCCRAAGRYLARDDVRRGVDVEASPSRFATGGGGSSTDTNHAVATSLDGGGRQLQLLQARTDGPPIEMAQLDAAAASKADNR